MDELTFRGRNALFVDLGAIYDNLLSLEKVSNKRAIPVIKANGYGLGAIPVARFLRSKGYDFFAVATYEEAMELVESGVNARILILSGSPDDPYEKFEKLPLIPVLHSREQFNRIISSVKSPLSVHIKFNTGMNRLGFNPDEDISEILNASHIIVEGVMTHFSKADTSLNFTRRQESIFKKLIKKWHLDYKIIHSANSAGILRGFHYGNMIRPGIFLYGSLPSPSFPRPDYQRIPYRYYCRVIEVRSLKKGDKVSYGGTFTARKNMKIAVLGCGYGDGIPRLLSNKGYFLIKGKRVNIVGRVCMDMTIVDITDLPVRAGDFLLFTGCEEGDCITVDEIAQISHTIGYEILTSISPRVKRIYYGGL